MTFCPFKINYTKYNYQLYFIFHRSYYTLYILLRSEHHLVLVSLLMSVTAWFGTGGGVSWTCADAGYWCRRCPATSWSKCDTEPQPSRPADQSGSKSSCVCGPQHGLRLCDDPPLKRLEQLRGCRRTSFLLRSRKRCQSRRPPSALEKKI